MLKMTQLLMKLSSRLLVNKVRQLFNEILFLIRSCGTQLPSPSCMKNQNFIFFQDGKFLRRLFFAKSFVESLPGNSALTMSANRARKANKRIIWLIFELLFPYVREQHNLYDGEKSICLCIKVLFLSFFLFPLLGCVFTKRKRVIFHLKDLSKVPMHFVINFTHAPRLIVHLAVWSDRCVVKMQ